MQKKKKTLRDFLQKMSQSSTMISTRYLLIFSHLLKKPRERTLHFFSNIEQNTSIFKGFLRNLFTSYKEIINKNLISD